MASQLQNISATDWTNAAERLKKAGVFGDEGNKFPGEQVLQSALPDFEKAVQQEGYSGGSLRLTAVVAPGTGVDVLVYDQSRFPTASDAVAAWRTDYYNHWHNRVKHSVDDWIDRLNKLKALMRSWLPPGMTIVDTPPVRMHEDLMQRFGIQPTDMPAFDIVRGSQKVMRVQPKGLWVIGANGRVDLTTPSGSYILVDESAPRSGKPAWCYYAVKDRRTPNDFNQTAFLSLL